MIIWDYFTKRRVSNGIFESSPIALKTSLGEREKSQLFKMPKIFKIGSRSSEIERIQYLGFVLEISIISGSIFSQIFVTLINHIFQISSSSGNIIQIPWNLMLGITFLAWDFKEFR